MELDAEPGVADSGSLEHDLLDLLRVAGEAARENKTALALFVDELQYSERSQFGALITAFHRIGQMQLPVALSGAGLPQIVARAGEVRSYAERLFSFADIGPLEDEPAAFALEVPARPHGVLYERAAVDEIIRRTQGYPYFLQEWGKQCWDSAEASPVALSDVDAATVGAVLELDATFFRVRFERLTLARHVGGSDPRPADREGDDLQPGPRRHRLHRPSVRRVPATNDAAVAFGAIRLRVRLTQLRFAVPRHRRPWCPSDCLPAPPNCRPAGRELGSPDGTLAP